jgi:hypothetical protein
MFCNKCGSALAQGAQHCAACGQAVGVAPIPQITGRVTHHTQLLGILWVAYSVFTLIAGVVLWIVANTIFGHFRTQIDPEIPGFLHPLLGCIAVFILAKGIAGLAAGWGLLQRLAWGRLWSIIMGVIALINIPFGTALGIYTLWTLLPRESAKEYEVTARAF